MTQMTDNLSNPGTQAQPGTTESPGTVDPHLAEWDRANRPPAQPTIPQELLPVIKFAETQMVEKVRAEIDKEVETAVSSITGQEEFKGVPKRIARGFLEAWALEHPEVKQAYEGRKANPKGWQSALESAGKGFAEDMKSFGGGESKVRSDVLAAKAAVRGVSTNEPPPQRAKSAAELRNLSDGEFRRYKATLAAQAQRR